MELEAAKRIVQEAGYAIFKKDRVHRLHMRLWLDGTQFVSAATAYEVLDFNMWDAMSAEVKRRAVFTLRMRRPAGSPRRAA